MIVVLFFFFFKLPMLLFLANATLVLSSEHSSKYLTRVPYQLAISSGAEKTGNCNKS